MIIQADAVINPGTVVVEALHTLIAYAAMTRTICANDFTVCAEEHWVEYLHHFHERDALRALQVPWILTQGTHMQD